MVGFCDLLGTPYAPVSKIPSVNAGLGITVDGRGKISEPHATGTSKLDWRSLESMQIDRNKVQIRTNWQKGTGTKKPENFRNFENFKEKKCQNSPLCSISDLIIAGQVP